MLEFFDQLTGQCARSEEQFIAVVEACGFNDWLIRMLRDYRCHKVIHHWPVREEPEEVIKHSIAEVTVKTFVGGLIKGLEHNAASRHAMAAGTLVSEHTPIIETSRCRDFQRGVTGT